MMLAEIIATHRVADCIGEIVIAQVKPQFAGTAQRRIEARGVPTINPCERVTIPNRHGRDVGYRPLFAGYLFACLPDQFSRYVVRDAFGVWGIFDAPDQKTLRHELAQIERMLVLDPGLAESRPLRPGVRAVVIRGPWRGMIGIVEPSSKAGVFVLPLSIFGRAVPTEIPISDLEPC